MEKCLSVCAHELAVTGHRSRFNRSSLSLPNLLTMRGSSLAWLEESFLSLFSTKKTVPRLFRTMYHHGDTSVVAEGAAPTHQIARIARPDGAAVQTGRPALIHRWQFAYLLLLALVFTRSQSARRPCSHRQPLPLTRQIL